MIPMPSMTVPNDATLLLWEALGRPRSHSDQDDALIGMLRRSVWGPDIDPNAVFDDQSLLLQALDRKHGQAQTEVQPDGFRTNSFEGPVLDLMDRGANPWASISPSPGSFLQEREKAQLISGLAPIEQAREARAWTTAKAMLQHPLRPEWNVLMNQPSMGHSTFARVVGLLPAWLQVVVESGLDPNWVDAEGVPVLFRVRSLPAAQWLVNQGADPTALDRQGRNLIAHRELDDKTRPGSERMNEAERVQWVDLMGRAQVDDAQILAQALSGKTVQVRPLFAKVSDLPKWRHQPEGFSRAVNLLDVAILANLIGGTERHNSLLSQMAKHKGWENPTADLLRLHTDWSHNNWVSLGSPVTQVEKGDVPVLLGAIDELMAFGRALAPVLPHQQESFSSWFTVCPAGEAQAAVLDRWIAWMSDQPERWGQKNSSFPFLSHSTPKASYALQMAEWTETLAPHHRAALQASAILRHLNAFINSPGQFEEAETVAIQAMPELFYQWTEAQVDLREAPWADVVQMLSEQSGKAGVAFQAQMRQHRSGPLKPESDARARSKLRT